MKHGVTGKRNTKKLNHTENCLEREPTVKRCLLILDLMPLRSKIKGKHSIGRELLSLVV